MRNEGAAQRLRHIRNLLGWSQRQIAQEFGVSHAIIALWENGQRPIPGPVLRLIEMYEEELTLNADDDEGDSLDSLLTSRFDRNMKLSQSAASVMAMYANAAVTQLLKPGSTSRLKQKTQTAIAQRLVKDLGELKGLMMKIGQMLSYVHPGINEEVRLILAELQTHSKPVHSSQLIDLFLEDFGQTPKQLFAEWSPKPLSSASIGQVYRARLRSGEEVAVKIQYPGIEETIRADSKNIETLDKLLSVLVPSLRHTQIAQELSLLLLQECDYGAELQSQQTMRTILSDQPGVYVPRVFSEFSSKRVITSEFINGDDFAMFLRRASTDQKQHAGELIFRVYFETIFNHGLFNTDPHPGNYLFRDNEVVFLDFGAIKKYSPEFVLGFRNFLLAFMEEDHARIDHLTDQLGFNPNPGHGEFDYDYNRYMLGALFKPCIAPQPFQFTEKLIEESWQALIPTHKNAKHVRLPREWLFMNRTQWGLYSILAMLETKGDWRGAMLEILTDAHLR